MGFLRTKLKVSLLILMLSFVSNIFAKNDDEISMRCNDDTFKKIPRHLQLLISRSYSEPWEKVSHGKHACHILYGKFLDKKRRNVEMFSFYSSLPYECYEHGGKKKLYGDYVFTKSRVGLWKMTGCRDALG